MTLAGPCSSAALCPADGTVLPGIRKGGSAPEDLACLAESKQHAAEAILGRGKYPDPSGVLFHMLWCGGNGIFLSAVQKQVDFYHSLPVRRNGCFSAGNLGGCLIDHDPLRGSGGRFSVRCGRGSRGHSAENWPRTAARGLVMFLLLFLCFIPFPFWLCC